MLRASHLFLPALTAAALTLPAGDPLPAPPATPGRRLPALALELVGDGYDRPVFVAGDPARHGRLLVVEQRGRIRRIVNGRQKRRDFLDLRNRVSSGNERGLLSLAFDPQWPARRFLYVNYTDTAGDTVIARHRVRRNLNRASPAGTAVLEIDQPFANHNGGQLQFGPDGYLYVGTGDGGGAGDPLGAGQNPATLLGKLLRIDVSSLPFAVPPDNPVLPGVGRSAVWALGLRNPWRFSFDRATGDLYLGDVGQGRREEIDYLPAGAPAGANFGWAAREGTLPFDGGVLPAVLPLIDPIHEYGRSEGFSITGGYVYRGTEIPDLVGAYLFADFGSRRVWALEVRNGRARQLVELSDTLTGTDETTPAVSSFGEDAAGNLYLCDYFNGAVYRIVADPSR